MGKHILIALTLIVSTMTMLAASVLIPDSGSRMTFASTSIPAAKDSEGYNFKIKEGFFGEFCPVGKPCQEIPYRENIITNAGLNHLELMMGVGASSPVKYLALGNGTAVAVGDTTLNSEQTNICGLGRATGTYYDLGNGWWEINTTFTYNCSSALKINTTANFNASSTGTLYAGGTISDVNFATSGDQLKLRHNFSASEG